MNLPTKAKRYLQALGHKSKNDSIDAKGLARMGLEQLRPLWQPLSQNIYQLRLLTRQLEDKPTLRRPINWGSLQYDVIGEETIADAVLDRLVHSFYRIELKGESLRKKQ